MSGLTWATVVSLFVASLVWAAVTDMLKDEVRARLGRLPFWLLGLAGRRLPLAARSDVVDEWNAELEFILRDTEGLPLTRLVRGTRYATDMLLRGAPGIAREMGDQWAIREQLTSPAASVLEQRSAWRNLYPQGRHIFYEGDDPAGFAEEVRAEFGFDPTADPHWGTRIGSEDNGFDSYSFYCPGDLLDSIYGVGRFPMGS
ncbi:hypothetical protein [Micromonospora sp. NPDC049102]|uniref:hypothetical protein n=1 Tax=Micromonospora sp. NPDC049102 TaxID=3364265 RepID=UPI00371D4EAB